MGLGWSRRCNWRYGWVRDGTGDEGGDGTESCAGDRSEDGARAMNRIGMRLVMLLYIGLGMGHAAENGKKLIMK